MKAVAAIGALCLLKRFPKRRVERDFSTAAGQPISEVEFDELARCVLDLTYGLPTQERELLDEHGLGASCDADGWGVLNAHVAGGPQYFRAYQQDALVRLDMIRSARKLNAKASQLIVPWRSSAGSIAALQLLNPKRPDDVRFVLDRLPTEPYGAERFAKFKALSEAFSIALVDGPIDVLAMRLLHRSEHRNSVVLAVPDGLQLGAFLHQCVGRDVHLGLECSKRSDAYECGLRAVGSAVIHKHQRPTGGWKSVLHEGWQDYPLDDALSTDQADGP